MVPILFSFNVTDVILERLLVIMYGLGDIIIAICRDMTSLLLMIPVLLVQRDLTLVMVQYATPVLQGHTLGLVGDHARLVLPIQIHHRRAQPVFAIQGTQDQT